MTEELEREEPQDMVFVGSQFILSGEREKKAHLNNTAIIVVVGEDRTITNYTKQALNPSVYFHILIFVLHLILMSQAFGQKKIY